MESISPSEQADPVSEALQGLNVRSTIFCLSELGAPWAFRVDGASVPKFHLVLEGSAWLTADSEDPMRVTTGDLVVLPHGQAHQIGDRPESPATALEQLLLDQPLDDRLRLRCGGRGPTTLLLCGGFALAEIGSDPTLKVLPHVVRLEAGTIEATGWLAPLLKLIHSEASQQRARFTRRARENRRRSPDPGTACLAGGGGTRGIADDRSAARLGNNHGPSGHPRASRGAMVTRHPRATGPPVSDRVCHPISHPRRRTPDALRDQSTPEPCCRLPGDQPDQHLRDRRPRRLQRQASLSKAFRREFGQPPGEYRSASRRPPPITVAAVGASEDGSVAPS